MNGLNLIFIFSAAWLSVFLQSWLEWPRYIFGTSIALLPGLMVYAGMTRGVSVITGLALCGGLWFDSLSANPLGVSILPLFVIGFIIQQYRESLLRNNTLAEFALGATASGFYFLFTLFLVCNVGVVPLLGWKSVWQLIMSMLEGGIATPVLFAVFGWLDRALNYRPRTESSFRPDREIKRGRA